MTSPDPVRPGDEAQSEIRECPDCGAMHDVTACAREAAICDCCKSIEDAR